MPSQPRQVMVKTTELQVNPDYANLLPPLLDEDLENLEKSVLEDGILHSHIINPDKVVLDGHHRLLICKRHSINEVSFVERFFESDLDEEEFVISFNLNRRHLSTTQKVELGLTILKIEMKKARWRYLATLPKKGNKGFINVHPKSDGHCEERGQAIEKAAKKVGLALTISKIEMEKARRRQEASLPKEGQIGFQNVVLKSEPHWERGKAIEIAAKKVGLGKDTLWKGKQILDAAEKKKEAFDAWLDIARGKGSIDSAYQKTFHKEEEEPEEEPSIQINTNT